MSGITLYESLAEWSRRLREHAAEWIRDPLVWLLIVLGLISFAVFLYTFLARPQPDAPWHFYFPNHHSPASIILERRSL